MLPINVQEGLGGLDILLPLMLCCMMPMLFRGGSGSAAPTQTVESDSWYVTSGAQETFDAIVKETDAWRESAQSKRKKGRLSFLSRREPQIFIVDEAVPFRLYRIKDDRAGEISFELTEVADGGTSIKATYGIPARKIIQNFKAKMPTKILSSKGNACPSCGKDVMPDFETCPYCGNKLKKE